MRACKNSFITILSIIIIVVLLASCKHNPDNHITDGKKFTDWRLPTLYELGLLYDQQNAIGGFSAINYWSSTESDNTYTWAKSFSNGQETPINKS